MKQDFAPFMGALRKCASNGLNLCKDCPYDCPGDCRQDIIEDALHVIETLVPLAYNVDLDTLFKKDGDGDG